MTPVLLVELNRGELHSVEAPAEFATSEPFSVELRNHGEAVHVHVRADDALAAVARIDTDGNLYVERETTQSVPVGVEDVDSPVTGTLEIATGYGAEKRTVEVTVEPQSDGQSVDVDETLSRPKQPNRDTDTTPLSERFAGALPGRRVIPVLVLGAVAIAVAAAVANAVRSPPVLVGAGVVVGAVLVALVALLR
ncbi:DUF7524 family protein [Haloplanus aerogenes]|uniref:Uncharacterized protein n=1 Tax=Haloplanus aerogenes TaxID=660522 RepID=A0A3M0DT04_9EURY|nr:hypothetical protein [Haloplanus aerogenes]AZH25496.1 hypothetical protein DU502_08925 [Haloplanus aerogenes]RMB25209.1 hypothetical protein ATH50_0293 [Haloplanus aerogenes]